MRILTLTVLTSAVAACKIVAPDVEQPAVIIDPTDAGRAALEKVLDTVLGVDVTLADDALTDSSVLIIERSMPQSLEGSPAEGRRMDMPIQFRLVTDGMNCILVDQRDGSRHILADTRCKAEE